MTDGGHWGGRGTVTSPELTALPVLSCDEQHNQPMERPASQPTGRVTGVGVRGDRLAFAYFYVGR